MPRAVTRPYELRPPVFLRISTSDFSGVVFVMSLKSANVTYRRDGVSGLNVLTGIKSKSFVSNFEVGRPSFLSLLGISYRSANMLSFRPYGRRGAHKLSNIPFSASDFLKNFWVLLKLLCDWLNGGFVSEIDQKLTIFDFNLGFFFVYLLQPRTCNGLVLVNKIIFPGFNLNTERVHSR